jgi:hypothetical protein
MTRLFGIPILFCLILSPAATRAEDPKGSLRDYVVKNQGRHAFGLYINKKKVGWQIDEIKLGQRDGREVAVYNSESAFIDKSSGEKSLTEEKSLTLYDLQGEGRILFVEVRTTEGKNETVRTAVRKGDNLVLTLQTLKRKVERTIPLPKDTLALQRKLETWLQGPRKKGDQFENWSAAWEEDEIDVKEIVTFKEKKKILWGGVNMDVYVVQSESQGARFDAELRGDGRPLVTRSGGLFEQRMEKEALVKNLDLTGVDVVAASSIAIDKDLGPAQRVEKLTLEVAGLEDFIVPQSHRQRVVPQNDAVRLEMSRDHRIDKAVPLTEEERGKYLKATPSIQSDHKTILRQAQTVVGKEKDPVKAAALLQRWVYRNLRKSYTDNADNALAVLDNKAGDCTEHSLLFVALARAVNIPARQVGGIVYDPSSKMRFGWHAWAEIHDGSQWVTVDPTWNVVYVDATHIKLSEGAQDFAWLNVAGKMKMKVVKFETKK